MMLAVLKKICALNINERKARQEGEFGMKYRDLKYKCKLTSQGTQTGERAMLIVEPVKGEKITKFEELGMREKLVETFKEQFASGPGMFLISAPPYANNFTKQAFMSAQMVSCAATFLFNSAGSISM